MTPVGAMPISLSEIDKVQNPAMGAWLLWKYGRQYQDQVTSESSHVLLFFLILPICLHRPTLDAVNGTLAKSGLGKFCEKFSGNREELLAIHVRALKLRRLSLSSIAFGLRAGILSIDYKKGELRALDGNPPTHPDRIKPHAKGASKLGVWFQTMEPVHVFKTLKVNL